MIYFNHYHTTIIIDRRTGPAACRRRRNKEGDMDEREEMTAEVMYGSKTKQAYELIKQKILMLEYAPGQPLRELELSEQLSMSRTPIRAAIERLVADCFVDETAGKRTVVSGVSVDSFVELYEVREAMEMLCVSLAAYAWQDHSQIDAARDLVDRQFELATQTPVDSQAVQAVDREFHRALAHLSGNRLLERETVWIYDLCLRYIFYSMHMNWSARIAQEHRDILGAIERRDSQLAQAHVRNHLSKVKDAVLMGLAKGFDPSVELRNAREGYTIRPHGE